VADLLCTFLGMRPWRCYDCDERFHAWGVPITFVLDAHCPRCGKLDLRRIARKQVNGSLLLRPMRWMHFPAYRCEPCRESFFSLRRFRPSAPLAAQRAAS
jgi:hypothetical protein